MTMSYLRTKTPDFQAEVDFFWDNPPEANCPWLRHDSPPAWQSLPGSLAQSVKAWEEFSRSFLVLVPLRSSCSSTDPIGDRRNGEEEEGKLTELVTQLASKLNRMSSAVETAIVSIDQAQEKLRQQKQEILQIKKRMALD